MFIWDPMLIGNHWVARLPLLCSYQVSTRCCSHVSLSALLCSVNMIFSLNNYRQTSKAQETEILTNILSQTKQSTRSYKRAEFLSLFSQYLLEDFVAHLLFIFFKIQTNFNRSKCFYIFFAMKEIIKIWKALLLISTVEISIG